MVQPEPLTEEERQLVAEVENIGYGPKSDDELLAVRATILASMPNISLRTSRRMTWPGR